jgi:tyrosinase
MAEQSQQSDQTPKSRYQRVKEILDAGAGTSNASYQGKGRFWNLPLPEFLGVVIYGVRMIAPLDDSGCDPETGTLASSATAESTCHCGSDTADSGAATMGGPASTSTGCGCHGDAHDHGEVDSGASMEAVASAESQPHTAAESAPPGTPSPDNAPGVATGAGESETAATMAHAAGDIHAHTGFRQRRQPGRGKRSGLIKGLRGEFPFDGSYFPPLLWGEGTNPVAESDIQFIEQWIDDGCPGNELHNVAATRAYARAHGEPHPISLRPTNLYRHEAGEIKQRKNVEFLSPDEIDKLRCAIQLLKSYPDVDHRSFRHWAQIHGDMCQHGWEQFLPWHRIYLYYFEQALQDISPDITLPYWDWTAPDYKQGQVPEGSLSGIIPTIYRCYLTKEGLDNLARQGIPSNYLGGLPPVNEAFNSGLDFFALADKQFANDPSWPGYRVRIEAELGRINPLWHPYRYPGSFVASDGGSLAQQFHHHYPTTSDIEQMLQIPTFVDFGGGTIYDESFGYLDMNPHNTMHIWTGGENPYYNAGNPDWGPSMGDMLFNLSTGYDPLFWGHHSNVDRMWARWQELHPGLNPVELTGILSPYAQSVGDTLSTAKLGYEYILSSYVFETQQNNQITQFRSAPAGVHNTILGRHRKAEVQMHGIIQPNQSMIARIFLNQPDANSNTSIQDNKHYAGYVALFGHGPCIGGPGHCDPPAPRRNYDRRPHHHNTPWKARVDVTDTVKQLVADGATDIDINIVVIGADGKQVTDMLRMSAVSLTFKD